MSISYDLLFVSPQIYLVVISFMLVSHFHCAAKQNYLRWSSQTPCLIQYWLKPSEPVHDLQPCSGSWRSLWCAFWYLGSYALWLHHWNAKMRRYICRSQRPGAHFGAYFAVSTLGLGTIIMVPPPLVHWSWDPRSTTPCVIFSRYPATLRQHRNTARSNARKSMETPPAWSTSTPQQLSVGVV